MKFLTLEPTPGVLSRERERILVADGQRRHAVFVNLLVNAARSIAEGNADNNEIRVVTKRRALGGKVPNQRLEKPFSPQNVRAVVHTFVRGSLGPGAALREQP